MSSVDRRSFLKGVAAVTASAVVPEVLHASAAAPAASGTTDVVWKKAPCRFCSVGCGLLIGIRSGRAVAVKGDPESPVSQGLACVKGYHAVQALYGADRITRPLVRHGQVTTSPSAAYDLIARKIQQTIAAHGRNSVAFYGSGQMTVADAYIASRLFRDAIGTRNVDSSARLHSGSASRGLLSTFGLDGAPGCFEDVEHADVFVLWDHNMSETDPALWSRILHRRRTNPAARIVDLGTRTTRTSYASDRSLLYEPETEGAIANAICHELVARAWVDRAFVDAHAAFRRGKTDIGYDVANGVLLADAPVEASWNDYVRFLATYTPERVQAISGLAADDLRWLASLYGDRSRKVMSIWGTALGQHSRGTWINNLLYNIHLLAGKIATPGNGALCLTSQSGSAAGALDGRLPASEGQPGALSIFQGITRGDVRFLWVQGSNPMVSLPDLERHRQALRRGSCFLVVSEAYPTPTTDLADVVLPSAMWLEREGDFGSAERRTEHFDQLMAMPGDATSDGWQTIEVARRLGFGRLFPWDRAEHAEAARDEYARTRNDARCRLPSIGELRAALGGGALWPFVNGRETTWRYSTAHDPAADRSYGDYDFYGHPDHRAWIWLRPHEPAAERPDSEYPFWLETGRILEQSGTGAMTQRIPTLHRAMPHAYVEVNRADAEPLGIRSGDLVRLSSRRGALELEARIDYRSQPVPGRVFVPSFDELHPVNRLTIDAGCPLSGQPTSRCAVRLERVAGRAST